MSNRPSLVWRSTNGENRRDDARLRDRAGWSDGPGYRSVICCRDGIARPQADAGAGAEPARGLRGAARDGRARRGRSSDGSRTGACLRAGCRPGAPVMTAADSCFLTITEAASLISEKRLSPVELTRAYLDRIERLNGRLHAYVRVLHDEALAGERAAEAEIVAGHYRGALHGIPIALKDIYDTAGVPTAGGSRLCLVRVPAEDATTTGLLKQAGAILLGKLTTWEFAIGGTAFDTPFPPARHPCNVEHDPAGASSGSGAAGAPGLCAPAGGGGNRGGGSAAGPPGGPPPPGTAPR